MKLLYVWILGILFTVGYHWRYEQRLPNNKEFAAIALAWPVVCGMEACTLAHPGLPPITPTEEEESK